MLSYRPRRWLVHLALAFGAGVFLGLRLPFDPLWLIGLALAAACVALLRRRGASVYLGCMAAALLLGLIRCSLAAHPALPPAGSYRVSATVQGEVSVRDSDGRVGAYLTDVRLEGVPGSYRAYWTYWPGEDGVPRPLDGQRADFRATLYPPMAQSNPHGFDFRLYLLQKGVTIGLSGGAELTLSPENQTEPASLLLRVRRTIRDTLTSLLGEHGPLAAALLLSDKSDLPEDVAESFRTAGVAHVLAVSGLHVMIVFSFIALLLRRLSPAPAAVLCASLGLLLLYGLLVGMQASILRAGLLLIYVQCGHIARRRADPLTGLAAAFAAILLVRPLELFAAGFQMSFGAVLGLILLGDALGAVTRRIRRPAARRAVNAYGATLCGSMGTALPIAAIYHRLSLAGLLISPLVVAAVTVLLPLLIVTCALGMLWLPLAWLPAQGARLLCGLVTGLVKLSAALPFADLRVPRPPLYLAAAVVLALLMATRYVLLRRGRRLLTAGLALGASLAVLLLTRNTAVCYIQFSMGNADAAVIEDGSFTWVIDTGEYGGDLADYLLSEGRRADAVILTHLHTDHAQGLGDLLRQRVPVGKIYLSTEAMTTPVADACLRVLEQARMAGIEIETISAGDRLSSNRVDIDVLWPRQGTAAAQGDANDYALALQVDLDGVRLLQMSDVTGAYELYSAVPAQVLKVAHHGSAASTGEAFLRAVQPEVALLSARQGSAAALQRLADAGILVYDTDSCGALTLTISGGAATIKGFLQ